METVVRAPPVGEFCSRYPLGVDRIDGCYEIEHYHSYTGGTVRAVLALVQIGTKVGGTYRFARYDNGEVVWSGWPISNGEVTGEVHDAQGPEGHRWRWRLSLAGTECFACPLEDGRIGAAFREDWTWFDGHLVPIQTAPAGEPYRDIVRTITALGRAAEHRTDFIEYIARIVRYHPEVCTRLPGVERLARGESIDTHALHQAAEREVAREEQTFLDELRTTWEPRLS